MMNHALSAIEQVNLRKRIVDLEKQLAAALADKECWLFNYRELHKGYLDLDARLRKLQPES